MLADVVTLLVIATLMLTVEWRLALMLLLLQPPLTWLVITLQRYRKANYRVREELSRTQRRPAGKPPGLEVVQMFRRERLNSERFGSTNALYRKAVNGTIFFDSSISALLEWVSLAAVALVLAVGGSLVSAEAMGLGVLTTFILYAQRLFDPCVSWRSASRNSKADSRQWSASANCLMNTRRSSTAAAPAPCKRRGK